MVRAALVCKMYILRFAHFMRRKIVYYPVLNSVRIDGAVAAIMALDRAIRCGSEPQGSVYDEHDILFV